MDNKLILSVKKFQERCPYIEVGPENKNKTYYYLFTVLWKAPSKVSA